MDFKLTDKECQAAKKFIKEHNGQCDTPYGGTNGYPKFSYIFSTFGLGDLVSTRCNVCKKEEDITDIDKW